MFSHLFVQEVVLESVLVLRYDEECELEFKLVTNDGGASIDLDEE